ncbi:MAG TPA: tRNA (adenosine(37)-N6)-threonylcarbamoyltransferase complex dimerization subunit type 1 TsaB [Micromonosporaceae bacterium]|nr:tRNA (adenosine(37)-N6)-threonylcarbamoyltransferase complex dimerization subunit type 1 TsaB [Micromonosporaceae bacterium]
MLVLVLDSATPAVTAALARIGSGPGEPVDLLATRVTVDARAHAELLAPQVQAVLDAGGVTPAELSAVVAGVGPGPFTGLRVGLVTAVALGQALSIPTYGVCSLDAVAFGQRGRVLVATDARRKEVYWGCYADGVRLTGPDVNRPEAAARRAAELAMERAVGDGALRYAEVLDVPVAGEPRYPQAAALAALAADRVRGGAPSEPLTPLYLRRPDATVPGERKPVRT